MKLETLEDKLRLEFCKKQDLSTLLLLRSYYKEQTKFHYEKFKNEISPDEYDKRRSIKYSKNLEFIEDVIDERLREVGMLD
jgi:hypothetical protein